jgi:adenine-specific DNA-methyltransferase
MNPAKKFTPDGPVPVETLEHDDGRANIPTEELRDFVAEEEAKPPRTPYPRDPSLDPQLVWKGKDEQDAEDLAVPTVPIYIQETVHPQVIVENLRETAEAGEDEPELTLFEGLKTLTFEETVDFYKHADRWTNRMILGDSMLVMNSLAEKEQLRGKVQTIYVDPPYGIKFGSNWQVSTRKRDVKDGKVEDATRQPEQIRAFRDTWELGIHSYLSYLRDRLAVSRELLTESGSCFVQIGDENMHLVRSLMDEVFGAENCVVTIVFRTTSNLVSDVLGRNSDYVLWYARDIEKLKVRKLYKPRTLSDDVGGRYTRIELPDGTRRVMSTDERGREAMLPGGSRPYSHGDLTSQGATESGTVSYQYDGNTFHPGASRHWTTTLNGLERLRFADRLVAPTANSLRYIRYLDDFPVAELGNVWTDTATGAFTDKKVYVVQTNTKVLERCILMTTDPGDLVLDPTCGSGTTALCAEKHGRRWITIDTSRVSIALARTRMMSARLPAYLLADSPEGQRKEAELTGRQIDGAETKRDVRKGFVYKRVPHITLRSIANNPDIQEGMSREEIEAAIARHADQEILYDQPYENAKAVRVTGPFTVESLSPHRMLEQDPGIVTESEDRKDGTAPFAITILENLRKAGVQNTVRDEHLDFDSLEAYPGRFIDMRGEFTAKDGETRTVAISLGPEHGTVGADQVNEAAKESLKGSGADLLLVCAFAFDAHAGEEAKEFAPEIDSSDGAWAVAADERKLGKLPIMLVRMNPDLAMGDELLKKTGSGNLFMVFGEPDVAIDRVGEDQMVVEIRGVDVYDPTTGQVRSSDTDEIACWFIDTNYNAESFFVRHAYFTGAGDAYKRLKKALLADIDEDAWHSLYSTRSRPFPIPGSRRIAIKVINHYGDEVLKTYDV